LTGTAAVRPPHEEQDSASIEIETAVERWDGLIHRVAARHGMNGPDLEEIVQDLRIRLWRALQRGGEKNPAASPSYVYRAAMSAALDLLRRRRAGPLGRPVELDLVSDTLLARGADSADDEAEQVTALGCALEQLMPERRLAVRLHLDGKTRDAIAELTGWSEARTRNLLYRGLADLRTHLEGVKGVR
jgi:RNA polymerase sigma-70 factor (ECF subfamily)